MDATGDDTGDLFSVMNSGQTTSDAMDQKQQIREEANTEVEQVDLIDIFGLASPTAGGDGLGFGAGASNSDSSGQDPFAFMEKAFGSDFQDYFSQPQPQQHQLEHAPSKANAGEMREFPAETANAFDADFSDPFCDEPFTGAAQTTSGTQQTHRDAPFVAPAGFDAFGDPFGDSFSDSSSFALHQPRSSDADPSPSQGAGSVFDSLRVEERLHVEAIGSRVYSIGLTGDFRSAFSGAGASGFGRAGAGSSTAGNAVAYVHGDDFIIKAKMNTPFATTSSPSTFASPLTSGRDEDPRLLVYRKRPKSIQSISMFSRLGRGRDGRTFAVLLKNVTSETLQLEHVRVFLRMSPRSPYPLRPEAMSPRGQHVESRKGVVWALDALELLPGGSKTFVVRSAAQFSSSENTFSPARVTISAIESRDRTQSGVESTVRIRNTVSGGDDRPIRPLKVVSRIEIVQTESVSDYHCSTSFNRSL